MKTAQAIKDEIWPQHKGSTAWIDTMRVETIQAVIPWMNRYIETKLHEKTDDMAAHPDDARRLLPASGGSVALREYLKARRKTIEASIGSEVLAGNKHKEECERTALAEITALEQWLCKEGH